MPTNSQGVPWNTGYIVASGNLLTDFRSNVAAEAQSRLMTSRVSNMTDDRGVKDMLAFNLARDTYHQQQWLLGIEQLVEDGLTDSDRGLARGGGGTSTRPHLLQLRPREHRLRGSVGPGQHAHR